jgi:hemerythrin HHE cation binding domain-containing protein
VTAHSIAEYLTADHRRLDALLDAARRCEPMDPRVYDEFRRGLLRHIAIEEKILLPAARQARDGVPLEIADRLRLDHGAIAALLVPSPTTTIVATLRHILERHDAIEEGPDGLYAACDRLLTSRVATIVADMEAFPAVNASPHNDTPGVMPAVERALERAGYRLAR